MSWFFQPVLPAAAEIESIPPGETAGFISYWTGTEWVQKPVKYWTGTEWVQKPVKYWTGTEWVVI